MTSSDSSPPPEDRLEVGPSRFFGLDPDAEPPWPRRRMPVAGVVLAALLLVVGGIVIPRLQHHHSGHPASKAAGVLPDAVRAGIIAMAGNRLELVRPDGRARRLLSDSLVGAFLDVSSGPPPTPGQLDLSPDASRLVSSSGALIDLVAPGVLRPTAAVDPGVLEHGSLAPHPWTNGGQSLVVRRPLGRGVQVLIAPVGRFGQVGGFSPTSLGTAVDVLSGDPGGTGAVVTVGADRSQVPAAVELRDVGRKPTVLLSATTARTALQLPIGEFFVRAASFSSDGRYLAVVCGVYGHFPAGDSTTGVAVVDRSGRLVRVVSLGPSYTAAPAWAEWSRSGLLALASFNSRDRLLLWQPLASTPPGPVRLAGELRGALDAPAQWSPDGSRFVVGDERGWYVVTAATGHVQRVDNVPGPPVAWVGGAGG